MTSSIPMSLWVVTLIGVVSVLWIAILSAVAFAARAGVAKSVTAPALEAGGRKPLGVQVPPPA